MILFLDTQDFHDTQLELARDNALHYKALIIQRVLRGYKYRCDSIIHGFSGPA